MSNSVFQSVIVQLREVSDRTFGVIDTEGKAIIPFNYDYISNISSGTIAAFSKTTGWTVFQKMSK